MDEWLKLTIQGVFGVTTAVVAAWFSAKWAIDRVFREKWWERKEKAYAELIEALHHMIRYCEFMADEEEHRWDRDKEHPKKKEFAEKHTEAYWKIQKATDIGAFVISKDAVAVLNELRQHPPVDWKEQPLWEAYRDEANYYRKALSAIREGARKELNV